jgi:hypothetical protein
MWLVLDLIIVLLGQVFVVGRAWLSPYAPDPLVLVASFVALYWPRRSMLLPVVAVGWVRGLLLLEPVGGQVLCALVATAIVSGLREHLLEFRQLGYVLGSLIMAGCWSMAAALTSKGFDVSITGGRELVLGGLLSLPLATWAVSTGRRVQESA